MGCGRKEFEGGRRLGVRGFGDCPGDFNRNRIKSGLLLEDVKKRVRIG